MVDRLLFHRQLSHDHPQLNNRMTDWQTILDLLKQLNKSRSLVLCSASSSYIEQRLYEVRLMSHVVEIFVCKEHVPKEIEASLLRDYPKVKLVLLDDSSWKASAYHSIAATCDTSAEEDDHLEALKAARKVANEFAQQKLGQNNTDGIAFGHQPAT